MMRFHGTIPACNTRCRGFAGGSTCKGFSSCVNGADVPLSGSLKDSESSESPVGDLRILLGLRGVRGSVCNGFFLFTLDHGWGRGWL